MRKFLFTLLLLPLPTSAAIYLCEDEHERQLMVDGSELDVSDFLGQWQVDTDRGFKHIEDDEYYGECQLFVFESLGQAYRCTYRNDASFTTLTIYLNYLEGFEVVPFFRRTREVLVSMDISGGSCQELRL